MSRLRNTFIAVVAASSALVGSAVVAAPAYAASPAETGSGGDYCWTVVDTGYTGCFLTQAARDQAVVAATGRAIQVGAASSSNAASSVRTNVVSDGTLAAPSDPVYLLLTVYKDANYQGASWAYTTTISAGCVGYSYSVFSMGSFNDSVTAYSPNANESCHVVKAFIDINLQGNFMETTGDVPNVGAAFNDKISSLWMAS
jgi:hypothetical protein